jgi:rhodanese-related sulfurtransferase
LCAGANGVSRGRRLLQQLGARQIVHRPERLATGNDQRRKTMTVHIDSTPLASTLLPVEQPELIGRDELRASLDGDEPPTLLEALPERYYRKAHLPGARLMPHDRAAELAPALIPSRSAAVVVYCASDTCTNSDQAASTLRQLGYSNVRVYRGGKADWQAAGMPLERD